MYRPQSFEDTALSLGDVYVYVYVIDSAFPCNKKPFTLTPPPRVIAIWSLYVYYHIYEFQYVYIYIYVYICVFSIRQYTYMGVYMYMVESILYLPIKIEQKWLRNKKAEVH